MGHCFFSSIFNNSRKFKGHPFSGHTKAIITGFTAHMPGKHIWLGQGLTAASGRLHVLQHRGSLMFMLRVKTLSVQIDNYTFLEYFFLRVQPVQAVTVQQYKKRKCHSTDGSNSGRGPDFSLCTIFQVAQCSLSSILTSKKVKSENLKFRADLQDSV